MDEAIFFDTLEGEAPMPDMPDILRLAQASAEHAARRQAVIARNIAHADTPGFRAQDIAPFAELLAATGNAPMRATRPGHIAPPAAMGALRSLPASGVEVAPDGNSVSLEVEMVRAADARRQYDFSLGIYSKSLDILRASMGRIR